MLEMSVINFDLLLQFKYHSKWYSVQCDFTEIGLLIFLVTFSVKKLFKGILKFKYFLIYVTSSWVNFSNFGD